MKKIILFCLLLSVIPRLYAQDSSRFLTDSLTGKLNDVVIKAYEQNRMALETPAAIALLETRDINRFSNTGILPAINNIPGVKMEERSPGSYRLGIRGSAYNAPFGVRNVKVYYNDIPYTDPGGNTYLNQLGYSNFSSLTIIKEPGASLYGAGTGGVLLIESMPVDWQRGAELQTTGGSYGLFSLSAAVHAGNDSFKNTVRYQHLQTDGYRQQSALKKEVLSWDAVIKSGAKATISTHILYGKLDYQTPGGLTQKQYDTAPRMARPAAGPAPGAVGSKAAIGQETFLAGVTYTYDFNTRWQHKTTLYGKYTRLVNPNIRNYSNLYEPGFGGRTVLRYDALVGVAQMNWVCGAELQRGYAFAGTYRNNNGNPDTLLQQLEISNTNASLFTQLTISRGKWSATAGMSVNSLRVGLNAYYPLPYDHFSRRFRNQASPRIALSYKAAGQWLVYGSVSNGFAPPATEQLAPTGSRLNFNLDATTAWNYQLGTRGYIFKKWYLDITAFYLQQSNAIVQRRDALGGDYYLNAGGTSQPGIEALVRYTVIENSSDFIEHMALSGSYTGYRFRYTHFVQLTNDYSGKALPGVPTTVVTGGLDIRTRPGIYANVNAYYTDIIPLSDANDISAASYTVVDVRLGYAFKIKKTRLDIFAGINNLLNERYSLGNDINAFGGKYFNAAPGINYFAGLSFKPGY